MLPLLVASDGLRIVGFESERVWKSCQRCESCTALEWCSSAIRCWNLFAVKDVQFFFFIFPLLLPPTIGAISVLSPKRLPTKFLISRAYATASSFLIICLALTIFNSYVAVGCERLFLPLNRRCNSYLPSRRDKLLYSVNEFISPIRFAVTRHRRWLLFQSWISYCAARFHLRTFEAVNFDSLFFFFCWPEYSGAVSSAAAAAGNADDGISGMDPGLAWPVRVNNRWGHTHTHTIGHYRIKVVSCTTDTLRWTKMNHGREIIRLSPPKMGVAPFGFRRLDKKKTTTRPYPSIDW